jgi:SAM-dependent methyltransferase
VLQLHWHPHEPLLAQLDAHGFAAIALARHPLDVLVSILHFAQHEPRTSRWLNGEAGNEVGLLGASPCSQAFLDYATSERARQLLGLTVEWRRRPRLGGLVRYERLVENAEAELGCLLEAIDAEPRLPVVEAVAQNRFDVLRTQVANEHFWHGEPGLWRRLLPAARASAIADAHPAYFEELGYTLAPDPELDETTAEEAWRSLAREGREATTPSARAEVDSRLASYLDLAAIPDEEYVDQLYPRVLRRPVDADARSRALTKLAEGTLSRATLLHELTSSAEAARVRLLDDKVAFARWARAAGERPRLLEAPSASDEAAIAIPWTLARYRTEPRVLDVGYAFAEPAYLTALVEATRRSPVGVDLASRPVPGLESVTADVRRLPFPERSFDVVFCLSTLHHVGHDNRVYGLAAEHDPAGPLDALRELRRVLDSSGRLLVTVPCGEPRDYGWFSLHHADTWRSLFEQADLFVFEQEVYERGPDGWRSQPDFDPSGVRYAERGPGASALLCAELRPGLARQRARRALAEAKARLLRAERPVAG